MVCRSNSTWWWWGGREWYNGGSAYVSHDNGSSWQAEKKISDFGFIIYGRKDEIPPKVSILFPRNEEHLSGLIPIAWDASDNDDMDLNGSIKIFYKTEDRIWNTIAEGIENDGNYKWNSMSVKDGHHMLKIAAVDNSGNVGSAIVPITVDNTPPETTCDLYGDMGNQNWYVGNTTIVLSSHDALTDILNISIYYSADGGGWRIYGKPLIIRSDGKHNFSYYGKDEAGNAEEKRRQSLKLIAPPRAYRLSCLKRGIFISESVKSSRW